MDHVVPQGKSWQAQQSFSLACAILTLTDSYFADNGRLHYGIACRKGLWSPAFYNSGLADVSGSTYVGGSSSGMERRRRHVEVHGFNRWKRWIKAPGSLETQNTALLDAEGPEAAKGRSNLYLSVRSRYRPLMAPRTCSDNAISHCKPKWMLREVMNVQSCSKVRWAS